MESGFQLVNGINMYYEIHGDGEPLVLIHGGGSTITTSFGKIIPLLAKFCKVIAVELQAHGHTDDRDAPESFEQDASDVVTLVKALGLKKASFLGFSNGGNTAMQIAIRYPASVDRLIVASGFYKREGLPPGFFDGMKDATIDVMPQVLKDAFLQIKNDEAKLLNMFTKDRNRMADFVDWKDEDLASIISPTLIISGDQDIILPEHAVAMSRLISGSRLMIVPAQHGSYLGAAESPAPTQEMLQYTVSVIKNFLENS